jgi:predicted amidophosphoribosyltransferase
VSPARDDTRPCPYCQQPIYDDAERCPYCENYLSQEEASSPPPRWVWVVAILCLLLALGWILQLW